MTREIDSPPQKRSPAPTEHLVNSRMFILSLSFYSVIVGITAIAAYTLTGRLMGTGSGVTRTLFQFLAGLFTALAGGFSANPVIKAVADRLGANSTSQVNHSRP